MKRAFPSLFPLLFLVLVSCGPVTPYPDQIPAMASAGPADSTVTALPGSAPTQTETPGIQKPAITPTATIPFVPTGLPLLSANQYRLKAWTPETADTLLRLMNHYPNTLSDIERGYHNSGYFEAFLYSAYAGQDALVHFPYDPRAADWRWQVIRSQINYSFGEWMLGEIAPGFAEMVAAELNSRSVRFADLASWAKQHTPDLETSLTETPPPPGFQRSAVLQVESVFVWVLESASGFQVYPLFDYSIAYVRKIESVDLTGDGTPELGVSLTRDANFVNGMSSLFVFDLSQVPPRPLTFGSTQNPYLSWIGWIEESKPVLQTLDGAGIIQIKDDGLGAGLTAYNLGQYRWNGHWLALDTVRLSLELPEITNLKQCNRLSGDVTWKNNPAQAVSMFWGLTGFQDFGEAPAPGLNDKLRFRLGLAYALAGDFSRATECLQNIVDAPTIKDSTWVAPSKRFLDVYQSPGDLYRACSATPFCNTRLALSQVLAGQEFADPAAALDYLKGLGVSMSRQGQFDFNQDDVPEYWFSTWGNDNKTSDVWVIAQAANHYAPVYIDSIPAFTPKIAAVADGKRFQLDADKTYQWMSGLSGEPVFRKFELESQPSPEEFAFDVFLGLLTDLYAGDAPVRAKDRLLELQKQPYFVCNVKDSNGNIYLHYCDSFAYHLALAYELSGDEPAAVQTYWQLWHDFPESPYALMAQFKLEPIP